MVFSANAVEVSCHIHPTSDIKENTKQASIIGPFASESACEAERQKLFGKEGRCHCVYSFAFTGAPGATKKSSPSTDHMAPNEHYFP